MNLKKIWEGLREKKTEEPFVLMRTEKYKVVYVKEPPAFFTAAEKEASEMVGKPLKDGPMTILILADDFFGSYYLMGDFRKELLPILKDLEAVKKFFDEHKDDWSPGTHLRKMTTADEESDKKTIGFGISEHKMAA